MSKPIPDRSFHLYGDPLKGVSLNDLVADDLVRAEVAKSGCEGCYCEVAKWSETRDRWERYAFCKFLGGEVDGIDDPVEIARLYADQINNGVQVFNGFVHCMLNWGG